jgi:hypothetical protein
MTYASVTSSKTYSDGENTGVEITARVFGPTAKNQKSGFINFVEAIDIPEGHADGANLGLVTKQDVIVGGSIIGIMSGAGVLIEGATLAGGVAATAGILNNVDNVFTNSQLQSGLQQIVGEGEASKKIGGAKDIISVATMSYSVAYIKSPFDVISIATDATSIAVSAPKYINMITNEK